MGHRSRPMARSAVPRGDERHTAGEFPPRVSPDGSRVAYVSARGGEPLNEG